MKYHHVLSLTSSISMSLYCCNFTIRIVNSGVSWSDYGTDHTIPFRFLFSDIQIFNVKFTQKTNTQSYCWFKYLVFVWKCNDFLTFDHHFLKNIYRFNLYSFNKINFKWKSFISSWTAVLKCQRKISIVLPISKVCVWKSSKWK